MPPLFLPARMPMPQSFRILSLPNASLSGLFLLLLIAGLASLPQLLQDADTGWHLAAGAQLAAQGFWPSGHDPFSFTAGDYGWMNLSWAWDIAMHQLHALSGLYGLAVLHAAGYALLAAMLVGQARARGAALMPILLLLLPAIPCLFLTYSIRPHLMSLLFLAMLMAWLWRWQQRCEQQGCEQPRHIRPIPFLLVLALLVAVWANLHGGVLVVFPVLGAYTFAACLKRRWRQAMGFCAALLVAYCAMHLTPLGADIWEGIFRTLGGALTSEIREWQSLFDDGFGSQTFYPLLVLCLLIALWPKLGVAEKILLVIWLVQATLSQRHLPLLVVISLPILAVALTRWAEQSGSAFARWMMARSHSYEQDMDQRIVRRWVATLAIATLLIAPPVLRQTLYHDGLHFSPERMPVAEVEMLADYPCHLLLNHYNYGGYLIYRFAGKPPVFMDGRAETAYPDAVIQDYLALQSNAADATTLLQKYAIDLVLMPHGAPLHSKLAAEPHHWIKLKDGELATLWLRRDAATEGCKDYASAPKFPS